jgi:DNA-binding IclR family transcriptional regulator
MSESESALKIQSVTRAVSILDYFRVNRPHLSLQEITARSGMSRATAHRYVTVLRDLNLLRFDQHTNTYSLGSRLMTLAAAAAAGQPVIRAAGPVMESLVHQTNETVVLSIWDGTAPVVVRVDDNADRVVRVSVTAGIRLGVWDSAQGRTFCAFLDESQVPQAPRGAAGRTALADLDEIRRTHLAVNTNDKLGTRVVAAPVFSGDQCVATMAIIGTVACIPEGRNTGLAKKLLAAARRLSADFGDPTS